MNWPPPVVLGDGITALGVARNLGRASLRPYLACTPGDPARRSRWARGRTFYLHDVSSPDTLDARLGELGITSAVLIPCTDRWCLAAATLHNSAPERYRTSLPGLDVVKTFLDKGLLSRALEQFEVPHPETVAVTHEDQLTHASAPSFLKPRSSADFRDTFGLKAVRLQDRAQAIDAFRSLTRAGHTAVLQEYVPGPPTAHLFIDGFVDRHGVIRARFVRRRVRMFPGDFGNSSMTASVSPAVAQDAVDSLDRLLVGLDHRGVFNAEFKRDPRDGQAKLIEVNCRPWWFIDFAAHCGVDVSLMFYRDALDLEVATVDHYAVGERCGVLVDDYKAYRALRASGRLTRHDWLRSWIGATSATFALDDPLPALASLGAVARRNVAHRMPRRHSGG